VAIPATINGYPVTNIDDDAFLNQRGITSVTIPNSVTSIGVEAFASCSSLIRAAGASTLTAPEADLLSTTHYPKVKALAARRWPLH